MINWPKMLGHAEDWAKGFWTGAATASLVAIIGAVIMLLVRTI